MRCRKSPKGWGFYFVTFTLRFRPDLAEDLSVDGLRRRGKTLTDGVRYTWKRYLRFLGSDQTKPGFLFSVEVSPGGAVHAHAIFHGRRPDVQKLRMLYTSKVGDSPMLNVRYIRGNVSKALKEVIKYLTKGASPARADILRGGRGQYTDPRLAARVEVAFSGSRLIERLGGFRRLSDEDPPVLDDECRCPKCACTVWNEFMVPVARALEMVPIDWRPTFVKPKPIGIRRRGNT
jgi:hypothetical protein